ncbi:phage tail protein I [Lysobacter sp. CA199]|uniref:phage tail protein I n=1 Tax=Lysobacter sp. CA199 TaxID=3455608 RepID=UPI003F8D7FBA
MNSLLPPNASALQRALEATNATIADVPIPLRELQDADLCPLPLLPWLAWELSIDSWKPYWAEHVKRARVRVAIDIQRRKGTVQSVLDVVAAFGGAVALREWWQLEPKGRPHTFDVQLTISGDGGSPPSRELIADVIAEIERTKPVRSHFTFTQGAYATGGVGVVAAGRVAAYRRIQLTAIEPQESPNP